MSGRWDPVLYERARRALVRARLRNMLDYPRPTGAQLRVIAQLTERQFDMDAARPWFVKAALEGDPVAITVVVALGEPLRSGPMITEIRSLLTRLAAEQPQRIEEDT